MTLLLVTLAFLPLVIALAFVLDRWDVIALIVAARSLSDVGAGSMSTSLLPSGVLALALGACAIALPVVLAGRSREHTARWMVPAVFFAALFHLPAVATFGLDSTLIGDVVRLLSIAAVFAIAAAQTPTPAEIQRFFVISCGPAVLVSLVGIALQAPWAIGWTGRAAGTFSHPNAAGAFFAIAMIIGAGLWLVHRSRLTALIVVGAAAALFATQSLGSVLGLAAAVAAILLWNTQMTRATRVIALGLTIGIGLAALTRTTVFARLAEFENFSLSDSLSSGVSEDSFSWRILNWARLLDIWSESPIWGHGLGSTSYIQPLGTLPHSMPVEILVEAGLIGLGLSILLFVRATRIAIRLSSLGEALGPVSLGLLAFIVVNGSESNLLRYTSADFVLAAFIGITVAVHRARTADTTNRQRAHA